MFATLGQSLMPEALAHQRPNNYIHVSARSIHMRDDPHIPFFIRATEPVSWESASSTETTRFIHMCLAQATSSA
jgi:hypothetical protein